MTSRAVFKIFRLAEWEAFERTGDFAGSADDRRDGFIHMSYAPQVAETIERHYPKETEIVVASFDEAGFGSAVKLERSRGGAMFPHIYGILTKANLFRHECLRRSHEGFVLPAWCVDR